MKNLILILSLLPLSAIAQAATGALSLTPPTQYTDGSPMPASAITGYDVQCTTWTPTGGAAVSCTQFPNVLLPGTATGGTLAGTIPATGGKACFHLRTKTAPADSAWSNDACKTFAPLVPNPPSNVTVAVVIGINMAPVYKVTATGKRSPDPAGYIALNESCIGNVLFTYRGFSWRKVDASKVAWFGVVPDSNVAGPCKPSA
jgi:hypothetical protein